MRLFFIVLIAFLTAQGPVQAASPNAFVAIDAHVQAESLGRGINVLGYDKSWPRNGKGTFKPEYFRVIREGGFNTIRVNLFAFNYVSASGDLESHWLGKLDGVISGAMASDLNVIIDVHEFSECGKAPVSCFALLKIVWKQLAERYAGISNRLVFELLNEPNNALTPERWNAWIPELLGVIRESNPTRNVIVGGAEWSRPTSLEKLLLPPADRHLIASFHYYAPYPFTHQGAPWAAKEIAVLSGIKFGSDADMATLRTDFEKVKAWSARNNRPVYLGEFGAYDVAGLDERSKYARAVVREAAVHGFSWAAWQFSGDFVVFDVVNGKWVGAMRDALVPR